MTVFETLQWAHQKFRKIGIDSPMLDAEILVSHALGVSKTWLFSHFNDALKPHQEESIRLLVDRRNLFEPIAYIIGKKEFYGRPFFVSRDVLIPRPETEILVEQALAQITDIQKTNLDIPRFFIADVGTGSGAIAITLALETQLQVLAIDISSQALDVAKRNAQSLLATNIHFEHGDNAQPIIRFLKTHHQQPDTPTHVIICANLPYLCTTNASSLMPDVGLYEPALALFAGEDGLSCYVEFFRLLHTHKQVLPPHTNIFIELDPHQIPACTQLIQTMLPQSTIRVIQDLHDEGRVIHVSLTSHRLFARDSNPQSPLPR